MTELAQDNEATRAQVTAFQSAIDNIRQQIRGTIVGQDEVVDSLLITLLVGGHCLITGMPGTAKTLLVHTMASALGLDFKRIQFTPDLMPTDITGTDIVEEDENSGKRNWRFVEARSLPMYCWPTRSTVHHPKPRRPCWKPCRKNGDGTRQQAFAAEAFLCASHAEPY